MAHRMNRLDFYGYRDQNKYNIYQDATYEINRRQDEAIDELNDETEDLSSLIDAMKDTILDMDSRVNEVEDDIEELSGAVETMQESIGNIHDLVDNLSDEMSDLQGQVTENTSSISSLEESVEQNTADIGTIDEKLSEILGKDYASTAEVEAKYAKKESVYTKEECDEKFLTEHQSLENFYTKEEVNAIADVLDDKIGVNAHDILVLQGKDTEIIGEINALDTRVSELESAIGEQDGRIVEVAELANSNKNRIESLEGRTSSLEETVSHMASESDIEELSERVDLKADKADLEALQALIDTKADKTYVDDEISALAQREGEEIDGINDKIDALEAEDVEINAKIDANYDTLDGKISDLTSALNAEAAARESGDLALLGTSGDTSEQKTIYGTRAYALSLSTNVLDSAKAYTDEKVGSLNSRFEEFKSAVETELPYKVSYDEFESGITSAITSSNRYAREMLSAATAEIKQEIMTAVSLSLAAMESSINDINVHVAAIESQLSQQGTDIAALRASLDALADEVHRNRSDFDDLYDYVHSHEG